MKKRSLFVVLLLSAVLFQFCKKSDDTDDTTDTINTAPFQAYVNTTLFVPKTPAVAVLTYNAAAKTKTISFTAVNDTLGQMFVSVKQPATAVDSTFALVTYVADTTANSTVNAYYNALTNGVYTPVGTLKAGNVSIIAIDPVKKLITGTFAFNETRFNYTNGTIVSITSTAITLGTFYNLPYTFVKQ